MTLKTSYEEIVDVQAIGEKENTRNQAELLVKASGENLTPAMHNSKNVIVIAIDCQQDFMENGSLPVPNSHKDMNNFTKFIYNNLNEITTIFSSIDTHQPFQIFFRPCFKNDKGENPAPYTEISLESLDNRIWLPVLLNPIKVRNCVQALEENSKKKLMIWEYHCIQGTIGHALENQFANMVYYHSVAKNTILQRIVKGQDPYSEMYGIFKPEYNPRDLINLSVLNQFEKADMIVFGGEAKSHCCLESIKQALEHYENRPEITSKVVILEDCMSSIPGFEKDTDSAFEKFKKQYGVNIIKSTDFQL